MMRPFFHWHGNVENEPLKNKLDGITRYNSITFSLFSCVQTFIAVFRSSSCAELNEEKMVRNIR